MGKLTVLNHPLIQHKLTIIRRKDTGSNEFRRIVGEIAGLMTYEMTATCRCKTWRSKPQWARRCKRNYPARS